MARFKYTGESPDGPFQMYGATWENGATAEVLDAFFAAKLRGNPFFEEALDAPAPAAEAPAPVVKKKGPQPKKETVSDDQDGSEPV